MRARRTGARLVHGRLALCAAALVVVAGCGKRGGADATEAVNETFSVAIRQVGETFDPTSALPSEISAVAFNVYDWLFDRNHDGSTKPGIAEKWTMSPDARELLIDVRRNVTFQDGSPLTADDIAFSWERMVKGGFSSRVSRSLKSIDIVEPHKVRITFARPEVGFVAFGGFPIVSKAHHAKVGEQQFRAAPIGSGPYRVKELARGRYVDLERNDNWWGGKPEVRRARLHFVVEDTTRVAQLKTGEADLAMQIPFALVPEVESAPALKTAVLSPGGMTVFLALKTDNPKTPWADARVREAIALSVDHAAIVRDILKGYPKHFAFLAPNDNGYDPELKPYPFDPARAKALLKEAGATDLAFELPYISGAVTGMKETAEAVALYLGQVGIKASPKPVEGPQFIRWVEQASKNPEQDYVAVFIGAIAGTSESSGGLLTHFSRVTPFAWYQEPAINAMALQMAGIPDPKGRGEAIKALGQAAHKDMRYIPLWTNSHVYGMKKCIDFKPTLGAYDLVLLRDVKIAGCKVRASAK